MASRNLLKLLIEAIVKEVYRTSSISKPEWSEVVPKIENNELYLFDGRTNELIRKYSYKELANKNVIGRNSVSLDAIRYLAEKEGLIIPGI